jgi:hypothetical protein
LRGAVRAEGWAEAERPKPRESREIFGERRPILGHAPRRRIDMMQSKCRSSPYLIRI